MKARLLTKSFVVLVCALIVAGLSALAASASGARTGSIQGTVRGPANEPIANLHVELQTPNGSGIASTSTDGAGLYTFESVAAGYYIVRVTSTPQYLGQCYGGANEFDADLAVRIRVNDGETASGKDFQLAAGPGLSISGTVSNLSGGGANLGVFDATTRRYRGGSQIQPGASEPAAFTLPYLAPGTYKIQVTPFNSDRAQQWYGGSALFNAAAAVTVTSSSVSGIALTLTSGGSISGSVTLSPDPGNSSAVFPGIWIDVCDAFTYECFASAGVSGSGTYQVNNLAAGTYVLHAQPGGTGYIQEVWSSQAGHFYQWNQAAPFSVGVGSAVSGKNFVLEKGFSISGRVQIDIDANGTPDRPVPGASLNADNVSGGFGVGAQTDESGNFILTGLRPGDYLLRAQPTSLDNLFVLQYWQNKTPLQPPTLITVSAYDVTGRDFLVVPGLQISGLVVDDANGNGAVDAGETVLTGSNVWAFDCGTNAWIGGALWGADGHYHIAVPAGTFCVGATSPLGTFLGENYQNAWFWNEATPITVTAPDGAPGIDLTLMRTSQVGVLTGRVVNSSGGGIAGVDIRVSRFDIGWGVANTTTDANGNFAIYSLPPFTYRVDVDPFQYNLSHDTNYAPLTWTAPGDATNSVVVFPATPGGGTDLGTLTLAIGGSISGTVSRTDSGALPAGLNVNLQPQYSTNQPMPWASVDAATGAYQIRGLPAGTYRVSLGTGGNNFLVPVWYLTAEESTFDQNFGAIVPVAPGQAIGSVNLHTYAGASLTGTVTGGGTPLAGIQVNVNIDGRGVWGGTQSRGDGTYTVSGLVPGSYTVSTDVRTGSWANQTLFGVPVPGTADINLVAAGAISGTVTLDVKPANPSAAFAQIYIEAFDAATGRGIPWRPVTWDGNADGVHGTYTIGNLAPGTYKLQARTGQSGYVNEVWTAANSDQWNWQDGDAVTVSGGVGATANFQLDLGGSIAGHAFLDLNNNGAQDIGEPDLVGAGIDVNPLAPGWSQGTSTDAHGNYIVIGMRAGMSYSVRLRPTQASLGFIPEWFDGQTALGGAVTPVPATVGGVSAASFSALPGLEITGLAFADTNNNGVKDAGEAPVNNANVQARVFATGACCYDAQTGPDGVYRLNVPAGSYRIQTWVNAPGLIGEFYSNKAYSDQATAVLAPASSVDFSLVPGTFFGTLRGQVVSASGAIAGVDVRVYRYDNGWGITNTTTDANGDFAVSDLAAGTYRVDVDPYQYNLAHGTGYALQTYPTPGVPTSSAIVFPTTLGGGTDVGTLTLKRVGISQVRDFGTWVLGEVQYGLTATGGNGVYTWSIVGGELPPGVALRSDMPTWYGPTVSAGLIGVATTPGTYTFTLRVDSGTEFAEQICTVRIAALRNTDPGGLPDAYAGVPYSYALTAVGGAGTTVTWTPNGTLPDGLSLGSDGVLSGTPTTAGNFNIGFTISDGVDSYGSSVNLTVYRVHLAPWRLPPATQYAPYVAQLSATGVSGSYSFAISGGLPWGLTLDPATGAITGTTTQGPGRYSFSLAVVDSNGQSPWRSYAIHVVSAPPQLPQIQANGGQIDDCTVGFVCTPAFQVSTGGVPPFTWTATGLPDGLSLGQTENGMTSGTFGNDAQIIGVATTAGTYQVTITATGADGKSATQIFPLTISPLALWQDGPILTVGVPVHNRLIPHGGTGPYTATIVYGKLPAGLTLDASTLAITGVPIESGGFHVDFLITDRAAQTLHTSVHFQVGGSSPISVSTNWDLGSITTGSSYWNQLWACCVSGYTWSVVNGGLPPGVTLSAEGLLSGTATTSGTWTFVVKVVDSANSANEAYREFRLAVTPLTFQMNWSLPYGNVGIPYSATLTTSGAVAPVTWTVPWGSYLPPGLTLSEAGVLSGTPTQTGQYGFNLTATDAAKNTVTGWFTIAFYPPGGMPPVAITNWRDFGTMSVGEIENELGATGGNGTYTWSVVAGELPPGVSLRVPPDLAPWFSSTARAGLIGIATEPGTYNFTIRATSGSEHTDLPATMTVTLLRSTDQYTLPNGFVGQAYSYALGAAGNADTVTFALNNINAPLPPGLTMTSAGVISGTPTMSGYYNVDFSINDGTQSVGRRLSIAVFDLFITTPGQLPNALQNAPYSAVVAASGGTPPYSFTQDGGLPWPLILNQTTGVIAGTPTGVGNSSFNLTVTDANHVSFVRRMAIDVVGVPPQLPALNPYGSLWNDCTFGVPCSYGISVWAGGRAPFTWSASGLPDGLSMRTETGSSNTWMTPGDGEITGVPAELGTFNVQVTVTDADGASATNTFPLTVSRMMARDFDGNGVRGEAFEAYPFPNHYRRIRVIGGEYSGYPSYNSTLVSGQLPAGLVISHTTQTVSGTPLENGGFNITLDVTDGAGNKLRTSSGGNIGGGAMPPPASPGSHTTINVNDGGDLGQATIGQNYSRGFSACCLPTSYAWSLEIGSTLPDGLTLSSGGQISGTIAATNTAGPVSFFVRAADPSNPDNYGVRRFTLTLVTSSIGLSSNASLPYANVGAQYSQTLVAIGGGGTLTWAADPFSVLPPGLSISTGGVLSGTPTATGRFSFNLRVAGSGGSAASWTFNISVYPANVTPPVAITSTSGLGTWAVGEIQSDLAAAGGTGTYAWSLIAGELPPGVALRTPPDLAPWSTASASLIGVATAPGDYTFTLQVDSGTEHAIKVFTVKVTALHSVDQGWLPDAYVGVPYSFTLSAAGNVGTAVWTPTSTLPAGLTLSPDGVLSGTPVTANAPSINFTVDDGTDRVSRSVSLNVFNLRISTASRLPNGTQNAGYSTVVEATGGVPPYTFSGGGLPGGLSINASGVISGTNNNGPGNYGFWVTASDSNHSSYTAWMAINVVGVPKALPYINPFGGSFDDCTFGVPCSRGLTVSNGGVAPFTWTATGLPQGLTIRTYDGGAVNSHWNWRPGDGEISGVPTELGPFDVQITVTDAEGATATNTISLGVSPLMARDFNGNGNRGVAFASRVRVIGGKSSGAPHFTASLVSGQLPAGLLLNPATQWFTGTPIENGTFNTTLSIVDTDDFANTLRTSQNFQIGGAPLSGGGYSSITINSWDLGSATIGQPFTYSLSACCAPGYVWSLESGSTLPSGLSLSSTGLLSGTISGSASPGLATFMVRAANSADPTNYGLRLLTLRLTSLAISTSSTLPFGNIGTLYSQTLAATGGSGALSWTVVPGNFLPPGVSLSTGGVLSGTPASQGQFGFKVQVADIAGSIATRTFWLSIYPAGGAPPLSLTIGSTYTSQIGVFSIQLSPSSVSGGVGPYTFSLTPGAEQIPGMRLQTGPPYPTNFSSSSTAGYMGVIAAPGVYHPSIRVTDSRGVFADKAITVTVQSITILSSSTPPRAIQNAYYTFTVEPYGGSGQYAWSAVNLPAGLTINPATGEISGTPTTAGSYPPSITVTDLATATSWTMGFTLVVDSFPIATTGVLPTATVSVPYSVTLSAPGCGNPCSWSMAGGGLPGGLSLNSTTGVISGTPSGLDSRSFTVRASVSATVFAQKVFTLATLNPSYPVLAVSSSVALNDVTVGSTASTGLFAVGGTPPYSWTVDSGSLPPGITLVASAENYSSLYGPGVFYLRGRAMAVGAYTFTLRVTDGVGASTTKAMTWNVSPLSFQYTNLPVSPTTLKYGQPYSQALLVLGGSGAYPTWNTFSAMPSGLALSASSGLVTGTPASMNSGGINTLVQAVDDQGHAFTANVNFNISAPTGTTLSFPSGPNLGSFSMGVSASINVTPSGSTSTPPYTVTALTPLPAGMALVAGGDGIPGGPVAGGFSLMGVPSLPGFYSFTLEARDSAAPTNFGARTFTMTVLPVATLGGTTLPDASVNTAYTQPLVAFDFDRPATWTIAAGSALPPGLNLVSGNTISGTPSLSGPFSFALVLSDSSALTTTRTFTLKVSPLAITGGSFLPPVTAGVPYSYTFVGTGGGALYWTATGVPSGLTLTTDGVLSGTRTIAGGSVTLTVTASAGAASVTRQFILPSVLPNLSMLSISVASTLLSDAVVGQNFSTSLLASGGLPPYVWSVAAGSTLPSGLQLVSGSSLIGYVPGSTVLGGIPNVARQYTFDLIATDAAGAQVRRTYTLNVTPVGLVGNTSLTVTTGANVNARFIAAGGAGSYTFTIAPVSQTQDMLPPGIAFADGRLTGSTTSTGSYVFWLRAQDASGSSVRRQVTLTVNAPGGLRVTTINPVDTWAGLYLSRTLAVNLATSTYTWSVAPGSALPPGLNFLRPVGSSTTSLVGAVPTPKTYTFTLRATDDSNPTLYAEHAFTYRVGSAQLVTPPWALTNIMDVPSGQVGVPYSFTFKAAGGGLSYRFDPSPFDPLPPGFSLSADGVLSGVPQSIGSYSISMIITGDGNLSTAISGLTFIVGPAGVAPPLIRSGNINVVASVGQPYAFGLDITLRGGTAPFTWSVTPGSSLPPGLTILPGSNGVSSYLGGFPTTVGTYSFYVTVSDAGGQTLNTLLTMSVSALSITPGVLPPARVGTPYSQAMAAAGGTAPVAIEAVPTTDMPPGMSFSTAGVLSGTPVRAGIYNVVVRATDAAGITLSRLFPIFIDNAAGEVPSVTLSPKPIEAFQDIGAPSSVTVPVNVAATSGSIPVAMSVAGLSGATLSAVSGTAPFASDLSINTASLGVGTHFGLVAASAPGAANLADYTLVKLIVRPPVVYPPGGSAPNSGGPGSFTVSPSADCLWTAVASDSWITITGGAAGTGVGLVSYSLTPNTSPDARTGAINVNGSLYTITQFGGACSYTANPSTGSVPNTGGSGAFTLSTGGECTWTAVASDEWLTLSSSATGIGSATMTYSAAPNTSPSVRSATITVAGAVYTVTQFGTACSFGINPTGVTATSAGGTASVSLSASSNLCGWTASSPGLGVTPTGGSGPATIQVVVPANASSSSRWLTATIAGQPFSVYQTGSSCSVSLNKATAPADAGASTGSVDVTVTPSDCSYNTVLGPSWISVTSGGSAVGSGTLSYSVESNSTTYSRTGMLIIGGQTFQVTQAAQACSVTLDTTGLGSPFGSGAASGTIGVATNGANCPWAASSNVPWASVVPVSGSDTRTLSVTVASNASSSLTRSGELTIAGQTVNIAQAGTTCSFALEASTGTSSAAGGTASVRVIAPGACGWSSASNDSWLTITSAGSSGTSAVQFTAAPNPSAIPRTGSLTIAGMTYTVEQAGAVCTYNASPTSSPTLTSDGASGSFAYSSPLAGCSPVPVSYANWLTVQAQTFDGSAGSFIYAAAPNPNGATRSGTIQVGDVTFTVTQTGATCSYSLSQYGRVFRVEGGSDVLNASATAEGCSPPVGTTQPSFISLGALTGSASFFTLPYSVLPYDTALTAAVRLGAITFGGQILWIKQLSW